ncbi:MAG: winged helix-turn-helix transcriptional regulator [Nitrosotalea sp.]
MSEVSQEICLKGNQAKVLCYLERNPGSHLRKMKRDLGLALGTLRYHLHSLEKQGKITSDKSESFRYFFLVSKYNDYEKNVLKALYHNNTRKILMFIMKRKNPTLKDIVRNIEISYASVRWHVDRLSDLGVIFEFRDGRYKRYQIAANMDVVVGFLKDYHIDEWNTWSNELVSRYLSLSSEA